MGLDRDYVKHLCEWYFPNHGEKYALGTVGMDHICKDYGGVGTTCGYLTHWLLWKAGCERMELVNRTEPDSGFNYVNGENISRVSSSYAFVNYDPAVTAHVEGFINGSRRPRTGDFVIIRGKDMTLGNGKKAESSHIFVVLNDGAFNGDQLTYEVCQTGQSLGSKQAGHRTSRQFHFKDNRWLASNDVILGQPGPLDRYIIGWLNLSDCLYEKYPDTYEVLFNYTAKSSKSTPPPKTILGIWYVASLEYPPGWYYMFHKGYRVFYALGGQPSRIAGSGYWFTENNTVCTMWETPSGVSERIVMTNSTSGIGTVVSAGESDTIVYGVPFTMKKRTEAAPVIVNSYHNGFGLPMGPPR